MRKLILALPLLAAACANQQQTADSINAGIAAGGCALAIAAPVATVAQGTASNTTKAISAGTVAVSTASTDPACKAAAADVAQAIADGKVTNPVPAATPAAK